MVAVTIVLFEANLQPLSSRRTIALSKFFGKLFSYGSRNRTAEFLADWQDNQRFKIDSPVGYVQKMGLLTTSVEPCSLKPCFTPLEELPNVFFHDQLLAPINKKSQPPHLLKQLALEVINTTHEGAIKIYTDGSKSESGGTGSGILIKLPTVSLKKRNKDFCSVLRAELIAIDEALEYLLANNLQQNIWIFSDSRSAVQHLRGWRRIEDQTRIDIVLKLRTLSLKNEIHIQWVPTHIDLYGNEIADSLVKEGTSNNDDTSGVLTYQELATIRKIALNKDRKIPPPHDWYADPPGAALEVTGGRAMQTTFTRLISGHIKSLAYDQGHKTFLTCRKCCLAPASPSYLLTCMGLDKADLKEIDIQGMDFLRVYDLLDLI